MYINISFQLYLSTVNIITVVIYNQTNWALNPTQGIQQYRVDNSTNKKRPTTRVISKRKKQYLRLLLNEHFTLGQFLKLILNSKFCTASSCRLTDN